jgi:hypothetical protein
MRTQKDVCAHCGHKLKKCYSCGAVQTDENSGRDKAGKFHSACKECTAKRVLWVRYGKLSKAELLAIKAQHEKALAQIIEFLAEQEE